MNKKNNILVVYTSPFGSTFQIAEVIAQELYQAGYALTLEKIENIQDISRFKAVIIGAPIQYDKWLLEAKTFVNMFEKELEKIPVAYFYTCLTKTLKSRKAIRKILKYSNLIFNTNNIVKPISIDSFAGVLEYQNMSKLQEYFSRFIYFFLGIKEGDYRNWKSVYSYTEKLANILHSRIDS